MSTLKQELLKDIQISGVDARLDAEIAKFRQLLLDHGDPDEIGGRASDALKSCVKRVVQARDKALGTSAIYADLLAEGARIEEGFADSGVDLKPHLRRARKEAVASGLSLDESKALLRSVAQKLVDAARKSEERHRSVAELDAFVEETCANTSHLGSKGRVRLENALAKALRKSELDVGLIKEQLLNEARAYLEDEAAALALRQVQARAAQTRAEAIGKMLDGVVALHPAIDRSELNSSLVREVGRDAALESVQGALDLLVKKWIASEREKAKTLRHADEQAVGLRSGLSGVRSGVGAESRAGASSGGRRAPKAQFNSAMADKLRLALERAGKAR